MRLFFSLLLVAITASCSAAPTAQQPTSAPTEESAESPAETEEQEVRDELEAPYPDSPYERPPYDRQYDVAELFEAVCAACHGEDGDGDAPIPDAFSFATPARYWTNSPTVDGIILTLEDGIHSSAMRSFPEYKDVDRVELAEYVLDLRRALKAEE